MCIFCGGQCGGLGEFLISLGLPFLALYLFRIKSSLVKLKKKFFPAISDTGKVPNKGTKYRYCGEWPLAAAPKAGPKGFTSRLHKPIPLTLAITKFNNPNRIKAQEGPTGVKGWLLLLCINLTIFIPATCLYEANSTLDLFNSTRNKILLFMFKGLLLYNILFVVSMVFLALFSFYAGLRLWQSNPKAVKTAKAFLITQLILTLIILVSRPLVDLPLGGNGLIFGDLMKRLIPALLNFGLWFLYLSHSKRVRHTFGEVDKPRTHIKQLPIKIAGHTGLT
ncbi:MAG: DUF2569 family protein [Desulfobaccales bacterium]